jgi:acyl dehydratase
MNPVAPAVGDRLEKRILAPISRTDIVCYQGASGDFEPIHHDEPFARTAGYEAPLVVGMLPAGMLTAWASEIFGPMNTRRTRIRWKSQVWPDDILICEGEVTHVYSESHERLVDLELKCVKEDGSIAVSAWMTFVLP